MFRSAMVAAVALCIAVPTAGQNVDWPNVGNDKGGMRYSTLDQINRENMGKLKVAWTYQTGDAGKGTTIECTPIVIDGVMYITTVMTNVVALDAATGKQLWRWDPYEKPIVPLIRASGGVNRGVAYWSDGQKDGEKRVLVGLADGRLVSLDAKTGRPDGEFGESGIVNLRAGYDRDLSRLPYGPTSAPAVFENLVILGFSNSETMPSAPGDVRAFDVRTGKELWRFHTVPHKGEFGNETWEADEWKNRGGANPWGGLTVDEKNGVVYCGTGSVNPDFYGRDRKGTNLFGNCVLALDARTGRRLWHFQTVHHDLWDHDIPCPPVLVQVKRDGKVIDAVAQVTKTAHCFVFERLTGKPLFDIVEKPAPASDVPGETAYPTQPSPVKPAPFARRIFREEDATDISPEANAYVREQLKKYRHGSENDPPSLRGTVTMPGFHGGATWSGASFDPTTNILYVNSNEAPYLSVLKKLDNGEYGLTAYGYFNDADGYPAIKPPWGWLNAIDLNTGEYLFRAVLGEFPELTKKGIPQTGTENFGGTIVTAGGLVFIGSTKDERFRAFDKATGKVLWEYQLPAGGYATPSTYMVNGKQFVVIAAGGGGKLKTRSGDTFFVFALPD